MCSWLLLSAPDPALGVSPSRQKGRTAPVELEEY